jgi:hypothetical protein
MKIDFSEPVVKDFDGDMSKKWHIYYRVFNPMTGEMETIRNYSGLHVIKDFSCRQEVAYKKCAAIYEKLKIGWHPFDFVSVENMLT